jgi:outer membrane protein assembly factor BamA
MRGLAVLVIAQLALVATARADEPALPPGEPEAAPLHEDKEFGPVILIEAIEITGNTATQTEIIRRALPIQPGDIVHSSDRRLRDTRFKVLALGYFRDVTLAMRKGSARGQVVIEIHVVERGTLVLNRLWFGTNPASPYWFGTDVGERNLLGLGVSVGGGAIYAAHGDIPGSRDQWAGELRVADGALLGTRWGALGSMTLVHGSEVYRVAGDGEDANEFRAFPYRRFGGRWGITYDATALSRFSATLRAEAISANLPVAPTQTLPDGRVEAVDLHLQPGESRVVTAGLGFDRDTRPDPILPHSGGRITVAAEVGSGAIGSDYNFATLFGGYEHWWPFNEEHTTIGVRFAGGVVVGDAPRFDRIYISDVDHLLTPRAMGLVLSTAQPFDILNTRPDKPSYGDVGGTATLEFAHRLFRGKGANRVYGGDVFVAFGLWGLAESSDLRLRDTSVWKSLPLDIYGDAGVRIDTDIGVFELTIGNALGRLR